MSRWFWRLDDFRRCSGDQKLGASRFWAWSGWSGLARAELRSLVGAVIGDKHLQGFRGRSGAIRRVAVDEPHDPVAGPEGNAFTDFLDGSDIMLKMGGHDLCGGLSTEGVDPGQGVVIDAADRIEIDALVDGDALELFGPHEMDRSEHAVRLVDRLEGGLGRKLGESEIDHLDLELSGGKPADHDVSRFDVAVDQVKLLSGDQGLEGLHGERVEILPRH